MFRSKNIRSQKYHDIFIRDYKPFVSSYETQFKYYEKIIDDNILEYCDSIIYSPGDEVKYSTTQEYKETMDLYKYNMKRLYEVYKYNYPWFDIIDVFDLSLFRSLLKIDFYGYYTFGEQDDLLIMPGKVDCECLSPSMCYLSMIIIILYKLNIKIEDIKNFDRLDAHCFVFRDCNGNPKIVSVYEMINNIYNKLILRYKNIKDAYDNFDIFILKTFGVIEYKSINPLSYGKIIKNINYFTSYTKDEELDNYYIKCMIIKKNNRIKNLKIRTLKCIVEDCELKPRDYICLYTKTELYNTIKKHVNNTLIKYYEQEDPINYDEYENDYNIINTCIVNVCRDIINKDIDEIPIDTLKSIAKICNINKICKKGCKKQILYNWIKRFYPSVERHFYKI